MTPVDGITHPKKNNGKRPIKSKIEKEIPAKKTVLNQKNESIEAKKITNDTTIKNKHRLVWIITIVIVFVIFIIWSSLIFGGKIIKNDSNNNDNFFEDLSNDLTGIWDSFITDYLKIKKDTEEVMTEEDKIKSLEEQVFPNFDEYK